MRIIIAGAGEMGVHLAKLLSNERMDITLLDTDPERLKELDSQYDILTRVGSPTSIKELEDAGVEEVDLFIAVTPYESINMNACTMAHSLGAKKTLARIDNYEYLLPKNKAVFQNLGVDYLIYPETLAAKEISDSLHTSWLRNQLTLCGGELELYAVKVRENAIIVNKKFSSGFFGHGKYWVVAIQRRNQTIIPGGSDEILPNDLVFFIAAPENKEFVRIQAGKEDYTVKNVMFMGGSKIAQKAIQILPNDMQVKVLEQEREKSYQLSEKLNNALIINADARNMEILRKEGIADMDAFVAVTGSSETNILACLAAKRLGIKKTIAEVENIDYIPLAEGLDIGTVLNKKIIAASYIHQLTLDADVRNVRNITCADAEMVEFIAIPGSKITRHKIKDIKLPPDINIGGLVREGKGMLVNGNTLVMPNDQVVVFCAASSVRKIEKFFN